MNNKPYNEYLDIHRDVYDALQTGSPVVALESTIISHGMPYPRNVEAARRVEAIVKENGAIPATIAIIDGRLKVGLTEAEIELLGRGGTAVTKASRRDIAFIVAGTGNGATTVAATMIIATMADIRVMATGGIGGVHRGAEKTMDVSADLDEMSRTSMAIVCAGIKSVLDIGRTLEYLETVGVPVAGYETDTVPAFFARSSGFPVDYRVDGAAEAAAVLHAKFRLGIDGAILFTNPAPEEHALDSMEIDRVIEQAVDEMSQLDISGKEITPFLLARIAERTEGRSLDTNIELVVNNARVAAEIALEYSRLANAINE